MIKLRTLSATIVLVVLSIGLAITSAKAAPESPTIVSTATPLLSSLLNIANTIGDDNFATADLTTLVDPSTTATQHYGPYASGSTDSGTCGNDWANDLFNRFFTVFTRSDGSIVVVEQFKDGTFTTPASDSPPVNFSPGACETSTTPQGIVNPGVTGKLHGYFIIPLPPGETQYSHNPSCFFDFTDCTTTSFIDSHFTPPCPGSCVDLVTTFFDHYVAVDQGLIIHEWKNASADRGGNSGDIRSSNIF